MHYFTRSQSGPACLSRLPARANWSTAVNNGCVAQVRLQLYCDQEKFCAYCEKAFDEEAPPTDDGGQWTSAFSHVEHFRPRHAFPALVFAWDNLLLSCNGDLHCGHKKGGTWNAFLINPSIEDPLCFIFLTSDGEVQPRNGLCGDCTQRADQTISILGLNSPALVDRRRNALRQCQDVANGGVQPADYLQFARDYRDLILDSFGLGRLPACECTKCQ